MAVRLRNRVRSYFGAPVKLGRSGAEQIVEVKLDDDERVMLQKSVDLIRGTMSALKM